MRTNEIDQPFAPRLRPNFQSARGGRCSGCKCRQLKRRNVESVMPLAIIEPEGLSPIGNNEWEEIEVVVDRGATENVMSPDALVSVPITSGLAFVRGVQYEVANGEQIPNLGEKVCRPHGRRIDEEFD